jgi:hypothetical protein
MKTSSPKDGSGKRGWLVAEAERTTLRSAVLKGLVVRRERWILSWPARLLALVLVLGTVAILGRQLGTFLAVTSPVGGQFLVVEGWMPSYAYREAAVQFRKGAYQKAIAAGTLDWDAGGELSQHFGGEKLIRFGIPRDRVVTTSSDEIEHDRTFHAALAVKRWLREQGVATASIDVVTIGAHARRSRLLYEMALGPAVKVGVIALEDRRFDPSYWWRSSPGVRAVLGEGIAYLYARLFFSAAD